MFCRNCGAENADGVNFCKSCGSVINNQPVENKAVIEDGVIRATLKPEYILGYKTLIALKNLFITLLVVQLFVIDLIALFNYSNFLGYCAFGLIFLIVIIKMVFEKLQYNKLEYNFYNTKVEYIDGFLNKAEKELKYKNIRESIFTQNILERMFNIGTIKVFTNAGSLPQNARKNSTEIGNGLRIHCIRNPKEKYEEIKKLIDEGTSND